MENEFNKDDIRSIDDAIGFIQQNHDAVEHMIKSSMNALSYNSAWCHGALSAIEISLALLKHLRDQT